MLYQAPDNYDELFQNYRGLMTDVIYRSHIYVDNIDDVLMDILLLFMEKKKMEGYDPEFRGFNGRRATFATMLRGFTQIYVLRFVRTQIRDGKYFPHRLEESIGDSTLTYRDILDEPRNNIEEFESRTDLIQAIDRIADDMDEETREFFDVVLLVAQEQKVTAAFVADLLEIPVHKARKKLAKIRTSLRLALEGDYESLAA